MVVVKGKKGKKQANQPSMLADLATGGQTVDDSELDEEISGIIEAICENLKERDFSLEDAKKLMSKLSGGASQVVGGDAQELGGGRIGAVDETLFGGGGIEDALGALQTASSIVPLLAGGAVRQLGTDPDTFGPPLKGGGFKKFLKSVGKGVKQGAKLGLQGAETAAQFAPLFAGGASDEPEDIEGGNIEDALSALKLAGSIVPMFGAGAMRQLGTDPDTYGPPIKGGGFKKFLKSVGKGVEQGAKLGLKGAETAAQFAPLFAGGDAQVMGGGFFKSFGKGLKKGAKIGLQGAETAASLAPLFAGGQAQEVGGQAQKLGGKAEKVGGQAQKLGGAGKKKKSSARGQAISKLMKEEGMTLGEASKELKRRQG